MLRKPEHFVEESFGGPRVSFCAQHEVNRLARGIDRAIEVIPFPLDFDVGFIDAERLLWIGGWVGNDKEQGVTPADFLDYREQCQSFAQLAAGISDSIPMNLSGTGESERLKGASVTTNYLDVFEVKPALGRTFMEKEDQPVVVLSHALWTRRFGADQALVNQTITLDGRKFTVIGVMPPGFQYPLGVEIWKTFRFPDDQQNPLRSREAHFLRPVAKLKPGVAREQAQAEVSAIARRLEALFPKPTPTRVCFSCLCKNGWLATSG
jgi:hypothetical protein